MTYRKLIYFWAPPVLWMFLIFYLSSFNKLQISPVDWQDFIFRKTVHFSEYFVLYLLLFRAFTYSSKLSLVNRLALSLILSIGYAFSDEFHQTFVSGRSGRFFDISVDSLGALFGLLISMKFDPELWFSNLLTGSKK